MAKSFSSLSYDLLQQLGSVIDDAQASDTSAKLLKQLENIQSDFCALHSKIENLNCGEVLDETQLKAEDVGLDHIDKLEKIGSGSFGSVYVSEFKGVSVAVKISQNKQENDTTVKTTPVVGKLLSFEEEIKHLRSLRHDNIIGYRGSGICNNQLFIVMEYIPKTLLHFINSYSSHDGSGLTAYLTWHISKQVANAMSYLHSQHLTHGDLKPDNILLDTNPLEPKAKLCDFGLSCHSYEVGKQKLGHWRYRAPEQPQTFEDLKLLDVFAYGLVVVVTRTGKRPWGDTTTAQLSSKVLEIKQEGSKVLYVGDVKVSEEDISGHIGSIIRDCCAKKENRPGFESIVKKNFSRKNPFHLEEKKGEFFSCGFLTNTNIFVADSVVVEGEVGAIGGKSLPTYQEKDLECEVNTDSDPFSDYLPDDEEERTKYDNNLAKYNELADAKKIDNNATIALKEIITDRAGHDEAQRIQLKFVESNYCHHRAMRDVWRSFDEVQKSEKVKCKNEVNDLYSTSFGLHVAIITKEEDGKRKFVFTKRSNKEGMASPGAYTCGAVESCSVKDYIEKVKGKATVSLVQTAARGLEEELGLPLYGNDLKAIHLNTLYLKFDNHEWGMCGFVDLNDNRVSKTNQFSFERLNTAFTSAPKDKFEHNSIEGVDFELSTMVTWLRKHHQQLASSAKIAVVKVLQAFFGTAKVTKEFEKYLQTDIENLAQREAVPQ